MDITNKNTNTQISDKYFGSDVIKDGSMSMQLDLGVKSLPVEDRPRERLLSKGVSSLSSVELLSIIISKGNKNESVIALSRNIINKFGSLRDINKLSVEELLAVKGIGIAKACQLVASFELSRRVSGGDVIKSKTYTSPTDIYKLVSPYLSSRQKEHFIVVALDSRRRLIAIDNISIGTVSQSIVHPREVFKPAINRRASFIVLAHNHPSGDVSPSADDITTTERLVRASYAVGIPILDHLIVSDADFTSMKEEEYVK